VLKAASRRLAALYDEALEPIGVNIAQFSLLRRIRRAETVTLTELGRLAELDRSTVGRNVRVLERTGLVALARGEDQREAVVSLTPAGHKALDEGGPRWDGVQDAIEARLGSAGVMELCAALRDL
jgi:DNA-binding MarR family transcriptional regulator